MKPVSGKEHKSKAALGPHKTLVHKEVEMSNQKTEAGDVFSDLREKVKTGERLNILFPPTEEEREIAQLQQERRLALDALEIVHRTIALSKPTELFGEVFESLKEAGGEDLRRMLLLEWLNTAYSQLRAASELESCIVKEISKRYKDRGIEPEVPPAHALELVMKRLADQAKRLFPSE